MGVIDVLLLQLRSSIVIYMAPMIAPVLVTADFIVAHLRRRTWLSFLNEMLDSRPVLITPATRGRVHKLTSGRSDLATDWHKSMRQGKQHGVIVERRSVYKLRKEFKSIRNTRLRRYGLDSEEVEVVALALQNGGTILTENSSVKKAFRETSELFGRMRVLY